MPWAFPISLTQGGAAPGAVTTDVWAYSLAVREDRFFPLRFRTLTWVQQGSTTSTVPTADTIMREG